MRRHLLFLRNPSQADLIKLYQNALAAVVPSRLEGWGLPLGEALWLGTPAIASPQASLPEVGRDLALYVDPDSPEELADLFERLEKDSAYRDGLVARIVAARPTLRRWRDVAVGFLETLPAAV
jgi:glycosyltransferase involved in cell wall biosynthesis